MTGQDGARFLDTAMTELTLLSFATVKEYARLSGLTAGTIPCPRCQTGTVTFSIASNGHARVVCDRIIGKNDVGDDVRCLNAME
jgi:hypothetical protein